MVLERREMYKTIFEYFIWGGGGGEVEGRFVNFHQNIFPDLMSESASVLSCTW